MFDKEKLLDRIEALARVGYWYLDLETQKTKWSMGTYSIHGLDPEQPSPDTESYLANHTHPDDIDFVLQQIARCLECGQAEFEQRIIRADGETRHISSHITAEYKDGQPIGVSGTVLDITKLREAENETRKLNDSLNSIVASLDDMVFQLDLEMNFRNVWVAKPTKLFFEKEAFIGKNLQLVFQGEFGAFLSKKVTKVVETGVAESLSYEGPYDHRHYVAKIRKIPAGQQSEPFIIVSVKDVEEKCQLEKKLKLNEERWVFALENANQGVWDWDMKNNTVFYSDAWKSMLGYAPDELDNDLDEWEKRVHPEDLEQAFANIKLHMDGKTDFYYSEHRMRHKNGDYIWIIDRGKIVERTPDGHPTRFIGTHTDITKLKATEQGLQRSEAMLRKAQETAKIGHWYFDVKAQKLEWSDETRRIHEVGSNFDPDVECAINFYHADSKDAIQDAFSKAISDGTPFDLGLQIVTAKGRMKDVRSIGKAEYENGEIVAVAGVFQDISKEKGTERLLRESEAKLHEAQMIAGIGSWEYIPIGGEIRWSKALYKIWEWPESGITVERYFESIHPEDLPRLQKFFQDALTNKTDYSVQHRIVTPKGKIKYVHGIAHVVLGKDGEVEALRGTAQDITAKVNHEKQLIEAKERAEKASQAKAQFLSMMSHEIRTPLNAVIGITHLLLQENPREDQLENLRILKFSAVNLLSLINDILDFSKIESGKIEFEQIPFSVRQLANGIVSSMRFKAEEKSIELKNEIDAEVPDMVIGDSTRLSQILNNLVNNAIKFTEEGHVCLRIKREHQTGETVALLFEVSDTGIGIEKKNQKKIFDLFAQERSNTSRLFGGSGLGLAITKKLLQLQNSEIKLKSARGKGSTFYFSLAFRPAHHIKVVDENDLNTSLEVKSLQGIRILLAEDNPINMRIGAKFLKRWHAEIDIAENGAEALKKVVKNDYDLILMDLQMPKMDGLEATRRIRALEDSEKARTPIVALTASALMETKKEVEEAGMDDYLAKPFNPEEFYRVLKALVRNYHSQ